MDLKVGDKFFITNNELRLQGYCNNGVLEVGKEYQVIEVKKNGECLFYLDNKGNRQCIKYKPALEAGILICTSKYINNVELNE